jgi:hypothetical protein
MKKEVKESHENTFFTNETSFAYKTWLARHSLNQTSMQ